MVLSADEGLLLALYKKDDLRVDQIMMSIIRFMQGPGTDQPENSHWSTYFRNMYFVGTIEHSIFAFLLHPTLIIARPFMFFAIYLCFVVKYFLGESLFSSKLAI